MFPAGGSQNETRPLEIASETPPRTASVQRNSDKHAGTSSHGHSLVTFTQKKMYLVRLRSRLWLDLNKEVTYTRTYVTYIT